MAIDGKIFLQADFRNLDSSERRYMSKCYFDGAEFGKIQNGLAPLIVDGATLQDLVQLHNTLERHAWVDVVEIDESAKTLFAETQAAFKAEMERKSLIDEYKRLVQSAESTMRYGCGCCQYKKFDKGYMCTYTGKKCRFKADEVEAEFEAWKEAKALGTRQTFYATAYPMQGCVIIEEGHDAYLKLQELNEKVV
jgi:hypothetical protein